MKKIKWVSFQPLIGGMSIGAEEAFGCKPEFIISYDGFIKNDRHLLNYWKDSNIPYLVLKGGDKKEFVDPEDEKIFDKLNKDIDVVVGVPICAGLSQLNTTGASEKKRGSDAVQNNNMYHMSNFTLKYIKPKVAVYENAPNLYTKNGEGVRKKLNNIAVNNSYAISYYKTDTQLHGIPQRRKRTFFFFWNNNVSPILNWYKRERKNLGDFLNSFNFNENITYHDIENKKELLDNHICYKFVKQFYPNVRDLINDKFKTGMQYITSNDNKIKECIDFCKENGYEKQVKKLKYIKNKLDIGKVYWDDSMKIYGEVSNAVIGRNLSRGLHPTEERFITIREFMCLMGLPTDFQLVDDLKHQHAITQNVPVCTARDMCLEIKKYLNGNLIFSKCRTFKQCNDNETIEEVEKLERKLF